MTNAEIVALEVAERFWQVNKERIKSWIEEDMANNDNTPADFGHFAGEFKVNDDLSNMTLDDFANNQLDFLDLNNRESISTKLWNCLVDLYEKLLEEITAELEDANDRDPKTGTIVGVM